MNPDPASGSPSPSSLFQEPIDAFVDPSLPKAQHVRALNAVLLAVHRRSLPLLALVQALGASLTSKDQGVRARGTLLLSEVLTRLPSLPIPAESLAFLADFLTVRLHDASSIPEVLLGLKAVFKRPFPDNANDQNDQDPIENQHDHDQDGIENQHDQDGIKNPDANEDDPSAAVHRLLNALFDNVHAPSLRQPARMLLLELLLLLAQRRPAAVRSFGASFSLGLLRAVDGEKDPRCLLLAFSLLRHAVLRVPGTLRLLDDVFDLLSCYFPIVFTPKDGDPITPQLLADRLALCFTAHPALCRLLVPFLLEKIADPADRESARLDSLRLLSRCAGAFGHQALSPFFLDVWHALKRLLLHDAAHRALLLAALASLLASLARSARSAPQAVAKFVAPVVADCAAILIADAADDPITASAIGRVLSHAVPRSAVPLAARLALDEMLGRFPEVIRRPDASPLLREALLAPMADFVEAHLLVPQVADATALIDHPALIDDPTLQALAQFTTHAAATADAALRDENPLFAVEDRPSDAAQLQDDAEAHEIAISSAQSEALFAVFMLHADCHPQSIRGLRHLLVATARGCASLSQDAVVQSVTAITAQLFSGTDSPKFSSPSSLQLVALQSLCALEAPLFSHVAAITLPLVFQRDAADCSPAVSSWIDTMLAQLGAQPHLFAAVLSHTLKAGRWAALQNIVAHLVSKDSPLLDQLVDTVALPLLERPGASSAIFDVCQKISQSCQVSSQRRLMTAVIQAMTPGGDAVRSLHLFLLCTIKRSIIDVVPRDLIIQLLNLTVQFTSSSSSSSSSNLSTPSQVDLDRPSLTLLSATLASLANKWPSALLETTFPESQISAIPDLFCWITRAYFMRAFHPTGQKCLQEICNIIASEQDNAAHYATLFQRIFSASDAILDPVNDVTISPIYRQRVFCQCLPYFKSRLDQASLSPLAQARILATLSPILTGVPLSVLQTELPSVVPIILRSLDPATGISTLLSALNLLQTLDFDAIFTEHLSSFLNNLLILATFLPSMEVRIVALQIIGKLSILPFPRLYPHRSVVIKKLESALDDPKRRVRTAAAAARNNWYLISQ